MGELAATLGEVLAARRSRAREAMDAYLRGLAGAPRDPVSVFHPLGGLVLEPEQAAVFRRRLPRLWDALRAAGIGQSSHSFGGEYLAADPCLYVSPPPWADRRRRIDARIRLLHAAMPGRVERSGLDFATWLGLTLALDVLRTDVCSVLWNELAIGDAGASSAGSIARCEEALGTCVRATLELLPAVGGERSAEPDDRRHEVVFARDRIRLPSALGSSPEGLGEDAVRALRASDDTFLVWASLVTLTDHPPLAGPCWAIGNGFGGLDLGPFVAATLAAGGIEAAAGTCRVGGHRAPRAEPGRVRWPSLGEPRTLLFCDDSVSSGGTFAAFRELCRRTFPAATVEPFVLTYDLGARRDDDAERARFALARYSTAPARWSPSAHPRLDEPRDVPDLLAALRGSSDEKLRWIAETQAASVAALNEARR